VTVPRVVHVRSVTAPGGPRVGVGTLMFSPPPASDSRPPGAAGVWSGVGGPRTLNGWQIPRAEGPSGPARGTPWTLLG
jgi:hypothetical protein